MRKIKHMEDIQREKMRLRILQLEQEKAIRNHWKEVKEQLQPGTLFRNQLAELKQTKKEEGNLLSVLLNYGAAYLSHRLTEKAGQKIESTVQQGLEKLTEKMNTVLNKKK
ncbi:MAG: hypothetical protein IPP43_12795 [Chitinophagaceae bacterium]|nr:hypothetical protein [Chitinophagaceae bacterium]